MRGDAADRIVAVRQGSVLATAFHPELTGDERVHRLFVGIAKDAQDAEDAQDADGAEDAEDDVDLVDLEER